MDKGFLFNLKMLFLNPKSITVEYILGKRKGILNPISFLILSVSLYLILEGLLRVPKEIGSENGIRMFESAGIYWHMVDLLWIVLFPLLYLIR